jgi:NitT/TauT family transport system substrate-binding protein
MFVAPAICFSQEKIPLRYGITASTVHLPVIAARDGGLFTKYGLSVEVIQMRGGSLIITGILSRTLQMSGVGTEPAVAARLEGGEVVMLACPIDNSPVYFIARPEIKSPADLKGKASAVTRFGTGTHFYLRTALTKLGLDPEKDMSILQLGTVPEISVALETGRIAAAALTFRDAFPFRQKGWPVLLDLTKTDFVYPPSCVVSSSGFVKENPGIVERFLKAYIESIVLMKKNQSFGQKALSRWFRETDPEVLRSTLETYAEMFKTVPYVPDRGIDTVLTEFAVKRPSVRKYLGHPEFFRNHAPLDKLVKDGWIDQISK